MIDQFPQHKCGLYLEHNTHKDVYETIDEWILENTEGDNPQYSWANVEEKEIARKTDNVWTIQWYPNTPIGFYALAAADINILLKAAREVGK